MMAESARRAGIGGAVSFENGTLIVRIEQTINLSAACLQEPRQAGFRDVLLRLLLGNLPGDYFL